MPVEKKTALDKELANVSIEFSADDEIMALIDANTSKFSKVPDAVLKCLTLIAGGSPMKTSCKLTGIPRGTLQTWRSKEWYPRVIELIRQQLDEQLDGKMTSVLNRGIDKLHARLENGDPIVNTRTGEVTGYKPVSAKDNAIITSIFFDKRNLLRNKPTSITKRETTEQRLEMLKDKFKEIAVENGEYYEISGEDFDNGRKRQQAQTNEQVHQKGSVREELGQDIWSEGGEVQTEEGNSGFTFSAA